MNLADLKDRLGDQYDALDAYVNSLVGQRDAARKESMDGRKAIKAENEALKAIKAKLFERLGLDDESDLDALPDAKGQAEAVKQFESRVKRLEKELQEASKAREDGDRRYRDARAGQEVQKALAAHPFIDNELAELLIRSKLDWDGDQPIYRHGETPLALDEGVKLLVQEKPQLLKQQPAGGSGWNPNAKSNGAGIPDAATSRQKLMAQIMGAIPVSGSQS